MRAVTSLHRELAELLDDFYRGFPEELQSGFVPRVEVTETDETVMVKVDLPGVEEEDRNPSPGGHTTFKSGVLTLELAKAAKTRKG